MKRIKLYQNFINTCLPISITQSKKCKNKNCHHQKILFFLNLWHFFFKNRKWTNRTKFTKVFIFGWSFSRCPLCPIWRRLRDRMRRLWRRQFCHRTNLRLTVKNSLLKWIDYQISEVSYRKSVFHSLHWSLPHVLDIVYEISLSKLNSKKGESDKYIKEIF